MFRFNLHSIRPWSIVQWGIHLILKIQKQDWDKVRNHCIHQAIEMDPTHLAAWNQLSLLSLEADDLLQARRYFEDVMPHLGRERFAIQVMHVSKCYPLPCNFPLSTPYSIHSLAQTNTLQYRRGS